MRGVATALFLLVLLAGCSSAVGGQANSRSETRSTSASPATDPETVYVSYLKDEGVIPKYGDADTAVTLGHQICDRYERGDSFAAVIKTLTDNNIPGYEAGQINGAATAAFCPQYATT